MTDTHGLDARRVEEIMALHDAEPALPCDPPVINGLELRKRLGPKRWGVPEPLGCCGWVVGNKLGNRRIVVTGDHQSDTWPDLDGIQGNQWIHASISRKVEMPTYDDLKVLHRAVFGDGWAYQVFAPPVEHISIHDYVLHLWGRRDGARVLPDFGRFGTI